MTTGHPTSLSAITDPRQVELLRGLLDGDSTLAVATGQDDMVHHGNDTFLRLVGASREDIVAGRVTLPTLIPGWSMVAADIAGSPDSVHPVVMGTDAPRHMVNVRWRWLDGVSGRWAASFESLPPDTDRADRLEARYDLLTGLPNRRQLLSVLDRHLMFDSAGSVAVLFIDLDHFKCVNDTFGHAAGDRTLRTIGHRLQSFGAELDVIARIGGDEFAACVSHIADVESVHDLCLRLQEEIARPIRIAGQELVVEASVGLTINDGSADSAALLSQADQAMYEAKRTGRGGIVSHLLVDPQVAGRRVLTLAGPDRAAGIEVWFQPIVDRAGQLSAVEALARWRHGSEVVRAGDFIPRAERTGDITMITGKVLRRSLEAVSELPPTDGVTPRVHVNVSQSHLGDGRLLKLIRIACRSVGVSPEHLCLEITESALTNDLGFARRQLHELRDLGCTVGMDDFGTGFASLTLLKDLPIDLIKIDQSFVDGLSTDPTKQAIVRSVVTLSRGLDAQVIAEGVETVEDLQAALDAGCDGLQGYYFGRPMPVDGLVERLQSGPFRMAER